MSRTIRMLHVHEPGYPWSFTSPDMPGLVGGGDATLEAAKAHAEDAARFFVESDAEDAGEPVPDLDGLRFVHTVVEDPA